MRHLILFGAESRRSYHDPALIFGQVHFKCIHSVNSVLVVDFPFYKAFLVVQHQFRCSVTRCHHSIPGRRPSLHTLLGSSCCPKLVSSVFYHEHPYLRMRQK